MCYPLFACFYTMHYMASLYTSWDRYYIVIQNHECIILGCIETIKGRAVVYIIPSSHHWESTQALILCCSPLKFPEPETAIYNYGLHACMNYLKWHTIVISYSKTVNIIIIGVQQRQNLCWIIIHTLHANCVSANGEVSILKHDSM